MNEEPVLIDDDDVDMEPVVILDDDDEKKKNESTSGEKNVETIVLDDETPIITESETPKDNTAKTNHEPIPFKTSEVSFINNLRNNRLMDKIVKKCISMENAIGMPRVVHKTLIPLYKDTKNTFKESDGLRSLLKKTYKLLMRDPDHKFLHIKTLCEELKSGGLRRKVPFVTLTTNLETRSAQWPHKECSRSKKKNQTNSKNNTSKQVGGIKAKRKSKKSKSCAANNKVRIQTRSVTQTEREREKTDIIDLDDSETEDVETDNKIYTTINNVLQNTAIQSDVDQDVVIPNYVLAQNTIIKNGVAQNNVTQNDVAQNNFIQIDVVQNNVIQNDKAGNNVIQKDIGQNNLIQNNVPQTTVIQNGVFQYTVIQNVVGQNNVIQNNVGKNNVIQNAVGKNNVIQNDVGQNDVIIIEETESCDENDNINTVLTGTFERDSNKENNDKNGTSLDVEMDYDLLIPKNVCMYVEALPTQNEVINKEKINNLEKQMARYKQIIDQLEETEVTTENPIGSAYCLSSKYKEKVVELYKQICQLRGNCEDIVKRREIRLHVAEGHPAGPAKKLEQFLNRSIDSTGAVTFPDFSDVLKCVVESNYIDNLAWSRQRLMQEAISLFRQCGQALRKRRQKREYRDLLSLVRDKSLTDDPAEKDPSLLAKLEENKLIAKVNEEKILERYVSMENNALSRGGDISNVGHTAEFESDKDSSDSESEHNETSPNRRNSDIVYNQPDTGQSSNNISLGLPETNNVNVNPLLRNNQFNMGESSTTNNAIVNNGEGLLTGPVLTLFPIYVLMTGPETPPNHVITIINDNQCATRESSIMNDAVNKSNLDNEKRNECETLARTSVDGTQVSFNTATNSEASSINTMKHIENTVFATNIDSRNNMNVVQDNVSSTTKESVIPNCDPSISLDDVEVKTDVVKKEPLDIQNMLNELGDGFVSQVFDIEDPFLVIEISSDGFTDEDEL